MRQPGQNTVKLFLLRLKAPLLWGNLDVGLKQFKEFVNARICIFKINTNTHCTVRYVQYH